MKAVSDYALDDAAERALQRKRGNLVVDYELTKRPALVWQCMPIEDLTLDVESEQVCAAIQQGAGDGSSDAWWYGFKASRGAKPVFDGLASAGASDAAGWATQFHTDGHLIAALWNFPELGVTGEPGGLAVCRFHTEAFRDFAVLASKVYEAAGVSSALLVTCTMLQAPKLALADDYGRVLAEPANRPELRWRVLKCEGTSDLQSVAKSMTSQFLRAFGKFAPKTA